MIILRLRGRLGNQLFIYAFGRALQEKYQKPLMLIDNEYDTGGTKLQEFNIPDDIIIKKYRYGFKYDYYKMKAEDYKNIKSGIGKSVKNELAYQCFCRTEHIPEMTWRQQILLYKHKLCNRKSNAIRRYKNEKKKVRTLAKNGIFICENGWIDFPETKSENIFGFGYFQSEKYFLSIADQIKKEIKMKNPLREEWSGFAKKIKETNSVCLSIRMGDYLNNPVLGVCSQNYYQKAIDEINKLYPDALIYIFSDDIDAVYKQYKFHNKTVAEPKGATECEKLSYMSMCKHFILSNSSFSWWAQYMSDNKNKTVISPNRWSRIEIPCDIYQKGWILIDV